MANNPAQHKASDYARQFQQSPTGNRTFVAPDGTTAELTPELYASGFKDEQPKYVEALRRTSIKGMINFYKANYPRPPYREQTYPPVKCPVLMIHGLDDMWLMPEALNNTLRYLEKERTPAIGSTWTLRNWSQDDSRASTHPSAARSRRSVRPLVPAA